MAEGKYLVDLNVLIALADVDHSHHSPARRWFEEDGAGNWGTCILSEAGFVRIMSHSRGGAFSLEDATEILELLTKHPGHRFWPIANGWRALSMPFAERIFGHQQVTDACLLGLAVREGGILVTMDKGIGYLAGQQYKSNLLLLDTN